MATFMPGNFKKLFKDPKFRQHFPEYHDIYKAIDLMKSCCGKIIEPVYKTILEVLKKDTQKWKDYLKTDRIVFIEDKRIKEL